MANTLEVAPGPLVSCPASVTLMAMDFGEVWSAWSGDSGQVYYSAELQTFKLKLLKSDESTKDHESHKAASATSEVTSLESTTVL